jgi:hypothetical protein
MTQHDQNLIDLADWRQELPLAHLIHRIAGIR